jgi:hypothetical protein
VADYEIVDFAKIQLTLPDKIDPSDAMSWQHHLYSKLGAKKPEDEAAAAGTVAVPKPGSQQQQQLLDELVERIVAMAKVLYGLHMVNSCFNFSPLVFICRKLSNLYDSMMCRFVFRVFNFFGCFLSYLSFDSVRMFPVVTD